MNFSTRDFLLGTAFGLIIFFLISSFIFPIIVTPVFSPGAEEEIISFIDSADSTLDVEIYVFSSQDVIDALIDAKNRGVRVRVIMEKRTMSNTNQETFDYLRNQGVEVRWASTAYKLTHSKFIILDGEKVFVGSHNFSNSALNYNREASVIITGEAVEEFIRVFEQDWSIAQIM